MQKVGSLNPTGDIYFHFEFFAPLPFLAARRSPYNWNHGNRCIERKIVLLNIAAY